jgi:hypothetical protein
MNETNEQEKTKMGVPVQQVTQLPKLMLVGQVISGVGALIMLVGCLALMVICILASR